MKNKILIIVTTFMAITIAGVILWPVISIVTMSFYSVVSNNHLESKLCSQTYYEPVGKDLAIICSNVESGADELIVDHIWWPNSVRKLKPAYGILSPNKVKVLFTCGFSHLSYVLEKQSDTSSNSNTWKLFFDDEGRTKYLTTIELSKNESWDFDNMFQEAIQEYEYRLRVTDKSDLNTLKENKKKFFTLCGKKENNDTSD